MPSDVPSETPEINQCFVSIDVECNPGGEFDDCDSIAPPRTRCEDRPFAMVFRYTGGTCDLSDNIQSPELFQCFDFQGGPPTIDGTESFITVTDIKGGAIVYHADFVRVGGEYTVADQPRDVEANMNITIYSSGNTVSANMLQTLVYHSSCSQNLFLKDRYGASILVVFVNEVQGLVSCFFNATYSFTIGNEAKGDNAILNTLTSATNFGLFNFTDDINGLVIEPDGPPIVRSISIVIDLTVRERYTALTTITARAPRGKECVDVDFLTFIAGMPQNPNVPTIPPTSAPTTTPQPTPDPEENTCELDSTITCEVVNGPGFAACTQLTRPNTQICDIEDLPRELEFRYVGGDCPGTAVTNPQFECTGNANLDRVWILIESNTNILYNGLTEEGGFLDLRGVGEILDVQIYSLLNNRPSNTIIQSMIINATCALDNDIRLRNTWGGLELIEFTTVIDGVRETNSALAVVEMVYSVSANTPIKAIITSASSTSDFEGVQQYTPPLTPIASRDTLVLGGEKITIDLINPSRASFDFNLDITGVSNANSSPCTGGNASFSFSIPEQ